MDMRPASPRPAGLVARRARTVATLTLAAISIAAAVACKDSSAPMPAQGQWQGGYGPQGQWQGPQGGGQWQGNAGARPNGGFPANGPQGGWPQGSSPQGGPSPAPVLNDTINALDMAALRQRAASILAELVAALPADRQQRVNGIPLVSDATPGEVNAFAGCDDQGTPFMATTDGLLEVVAFSARFRATDEVFGTHKADQYFQMIAQTSRPKTPLQRPGAGFIDPTQDVDGRKVARQNVLFDASLAFVLGHELGHHYLGHTGCANGQRGLFGGDLSRLLPRVSAGFNQPNEVAADIAGTYNAMTIGSRRQNRFGEEGAMLVLNFFLAMRRGVSASDVLFAFESTHPHPSVRIPIVQQAANTWRMTGGNPPPVISL
jgi:Zn-dependent protease with chaperone function